MINGNEFKKYHRFPSSGEAACGSCGRLIDWTMYGYHLDDNGEHWLICELCLYEFYEKDL